MSDETNKNLPGLDDKVIEITFTDSTIDNTHYKMVRIDKWEELEKELKELRHFKDSNTGLWATDKDPNDILKRAKDCSIYSVDIETFNNLFFQIK